MEIYLITNKRAEKTTNWLWRELIPNFGKPCWITLDKENKPKEKFRKLCKAIEITIRPASVGYPRNNG